MIVWSNGVLVGSNLMLMVITMSSKQFRVKSDEISARNPLFRPVGVYLHTSRFTGARRAMLERPPRARATDLGPETLHVPSMGPKLHKSRLARVLGG